MYKNILIPIDLSHDSSWRQALPTALELVRLFGAQLHVVTVVSDVSTVPHLHLPKDYERNRMEYARHSLDAFVKEHILDHHTPIQHVAGPGSIYREILQVARDSSADIIVMASHRPELKDYLLGANADRVVRHADCSVFIVREPKELGS